MDQFLSWLAVSITTPVGGGIVAAIALCGAFVLLSFVVRIVANLAKGKSPLARLA